MSSINAETFALFGTTRIERDDDLHQGIRDRLITLQGRRRHYVNYGSKIRLHPSRVSRVALDKSIFEALASDTRVHQVQIKTEVRDIKVRINNAILIEM